MASLTEFIGRRLRLKANEAKSAVARPEDRHFLGFRLRLDPQTGSAEVLLSERNAMQRVRQLTPRTWGSALIACISQINAWLRGRYGFFGIVSRSEMQARPAPPRGWTRESRIPWDVSTGQSAEQLVPQCAKLRPRRLSERSSRRLHDRGSQLDQALRPNGGRR